MQGRLQSLGARRTIVVRRRTVLVLALVTCAYIAAAKVGLALSVAHGVITPVWAPTAIAIAGLLVFGPRFWPAIAVGAFASNATSGVSLGVAAAIAVGNSLEALAAVYLLRRVDFRNSLERARDVLWLAVLAAFVSTTISATVGVTTLAIAGAPAASPYGSAWALWWLGDATGVLLVAPALLIAATRRQALDRRRTTEALGLVVLLALSSAIVFLGGQWRYPYLVFPFLVWATLRFRQVGAAVGCLVVAALAVAGVVVGDTPLGGDATTTVQVLQALLAFVAVSLLVLGATLAEREEASARLAEAQRLAHVGSWEWDIAADRVTWSRELYRIFDVDPGARGLTFATVLERLHPNDRGLLRSAVEGALESHGPFEVVHRIVLRDGTERVVHGRGRVVVAASGEPQRMVGTAQDVTERQRADEVRDNILSTVAHELRTPLTSILGFALTLADERCGHVSEDVRRRMTSQLAEEALELDRLLSSLLDVDRLRHGLIHVAVEPTDVGSLVERTVASIPPNGHRIELDTVPVVAEVDPAKVERIVANLVGNAIKHTAPGTTVSVSVARDDDAALLRVDDSGHGIPDAQKREVFEPFARGNGSARTPGTGIGLALVAQFAALQGGRAWVEDAPGGGASFRVLFPLRVK
jgi:signal transduction histidine kinase